MMRPALIALLLMCGPVLAAEIPLPPERPDALNGMGPELAAAPRLAIRPAPAAATDFAPKIAIEPARKSLSVSEHGTIPAKRPATTTAVPPVGDPAPPVAPATEPTAPGDMVRGSAAASAPGTARAPATKGPAPKGEVPIPETDLGKPSPPMPPIRPAGSKTRTAMLDRRAPDGNRRGGNIVCDDPRLVGRIKPTVTGRHPGCLIMNPVEITSIAGIRLSLPATLSCRTARTFANWVTGVVDPAARKYLGARIKRIWVMGSFACRTRNSLRGTRLSEHSVGRAMDVGGFTLGDGRKIRVRKDWGRGETGRFLRHVWKRACGMFKTVLGPDGDRFHRDHIHVDVAMRRSTYCR